MPNHYQQNEARTNIGQIVWKTHPRNGANELSISIILLKKKERNEETGKFSKPEREGIHFFFMKWKCSHESRIRNRSVYFQRSERKKKKSPKATVSEQNRLRRAPLSTLEPVVSCWPAPAPAVSILITKEESWLQGWMVKFYQKYCENAQRQNWKIRLESQ